MKRGIFTILCCVWAFSAASQVADDYRSATSGDWSLPSSWERFDVALGWVSATAAPASGTAQTISIRSGHTMTVSGATNTDQTVVDSGGTLLIASGTLTIANTPGNQLTINGILQINASGALTRGSIGATSNIIVNGTVNNAGSILLTSASRLFFNANAFYNHQRSSLGNVPAATWNLNSTCTISGQLSEAPGNLTQTFGHFIWNTPVLDSDIDLAGALTRVAGNLSFVNTGGFTVIFTTAAPYTLNVSGNLSFSPSASASFTLDANVTINVGGDFNFQSSDFKSSFDTGNVNLNITGNLNLISGNFDVSSGSGVTNVALSGNYTKSSTVITNSGNSALNINFNGSATQLFTSSVSETATINFSTTNSSNLTIAAASFLSGAGSLNLGTNTSLTLLSLDPLGALQNGTTGGNIRVGATRTYSGIIVYGASVRQYMSAQHPGSANTRINNTAGVSMLGSVNFTGILDLDNGLLRIENSATLSLTSVLHNGGFLAVNPSSSIALNGTGTYGNLLLTHISGVAIQNLTINRSGSGVVTQATPSLTVSGTLSLANGLLALGANTITTVGGNFSVASGSLSGLSTSTFSISGSGNMPSSVQMTGALRALTMNRASRVLNFANLSPNYLDVTNLNLSRGNISNAGGLRMANNGLITVVNGVLTSAIGAAGVYDINYSNFTAATVSGGFELPAAPSAALRNLTLNNSLSGVRTLSLTAPLNAAGNVAVIDGTLLSNGVAIDIGGNFIVASAGAFIPGQSTLTFDGSTSQNMSLPSALTMSNVIINKSGGSTFTLSSPLNVTNSFGVITASIANVGNSLLTLASTAAASAYVPAMPAGASIIGSVIVQRQLPNTQGIRAYRYIAPATTNSTVADWQAEFPITGKFSNPSSGVYNGTQLVSTSPSLFYYDETKVSGTSAQTAGYVDYPSSGNSASAPLINGKGYAAFFRTTSTPSTYDTRGILGQGSVPVAVTRGNGLNSGWNLVGNPYPAPVDWDLVIGSSTGIGNAIYFTDNTQNSGAANVSYVGGVATPGTYNGQIAQGQAFWVRVTTPNSTGSVNFEENDKVSGQTQFYRQGEISDLLRITMKKGLVQDEIAIRLHDDGTSDFDSKLDAFKFGASGLNISSLSRNNDRLSINSIGRGECDNTVPLFIEGGTNGTFSLNFTGLGSFAADVEIFLNDRVENKQINISSTPAYTFAVSDVGALTDRFEIVFDGPTIEPDILVRAEATCERPGGLLTLQNTQPSVKYTANFNGSAVSAEMQGNGGELLIPLNTEGLSTGDNEISVTARMSTCTASALNNKATLTVVGKPSVSSVKDGSSCAEQAVTLSATGVGALTYNWYESMDEIEPMSNQLTAQFVTVPLDKSKTYYVSAVNSVGCESSRLPVKASITKLESVVVTADGTVLISSYADGNQWYLDGVVVDGATQQRIEAIASGVYTVKVSSGACIITSEGREMVVTGVEEYKANFISVYPNPAIQKVTVEVKSVNSVSAKLINASGMELSSIGLSGQEIKSGEFNMTSLPHGVYLIRIYDGSKVFTKKLTK
ncbi:MAG: T9SS type A sorting domain-containing protein [Chryseolinea sp.]